MRKIIEKSLLKLVGSTNILADLAKLPSSELNSFLLELFHLKSQKINPVDLVKKFDNNRFVVPNDVDLIQLKTLEIECLKYAKEHEFEPVTLSPLTPLGTCSIVAKVHQNKVVSSLRGTEVVADATNVLALKIASEFKESGNKNSILRYATTHQHVRAQQFPNPDYSAHFTVLCLTSGGFDRGNFSFELDQLEAHLRLLYELIQQKFPSYPIRIKFFAKKNTEPFRRLIQQKEQAIWLDKSIVWINDFDNEYYQNIQFKIGIQKQDQWIELADGGDVNWTQKLLGNQKHRLFISGIGLEFLDKL
ncbi:MAG: hypothetical protein AAGJ18_07690 [Bacteroidota bacterium]